VAISGALWVAAGVGADRREYFVRFGTSKQNYGGRLDDIWYMRKKGGVLVPVKLHAACKVEEKAKKQKGYMQ